ncbi:MAG: hypothetical protein ACLFSQ_10285 [Candidatus Zixiibacteriota bacterium]
MPRRNNQYLMKRNSMIRRLYKNLRKAGNTARYAMLLIQQELRGELSVERIRKIIYSKDIPPARA